MQRIDLFGTVGEDFTPTTVRYGLSAGDDVVVSINSGGGYAADGVAIYNMLADHRGKVMVEVIGIAASAASMIAMAGDTITMADGAVMMIHDPMNITIGNSADHAKMIEQLEAYATAYAKVYAKRAGISETLARTIMKAETWFNGPEAVAAGFATSTSDRRAAAYALYGNGHDQKAKAALARAAPSGKAQDTKESWARVIGKLNKQNGHSEPAAAATNDTAPKSGWSKVIDQFNKQRGG